MTQVKAIQLEIEEQGYPFYKKDNVFFIKVIKKNIFIMVSIYWGSIEIKNNKPIYDDLLASQGWEISTKEDFDDAYIKTLELFSEVV